ncbi:MAG: sensor histidine kinase, partial [Bacteroidales bacterium]
ESDKLHKTLLNSISHELRIPVSTIMGASETLLSASYPDEMKVKLHQEIYQASIRLNRLIENLLNMSRLESGRISPSPDWCDVHDLANAIGDSLGKELETFVYAVVIPDEMPLVTLDIGLTEQAIYNLVLNATQYAPAGTTIRLKFFYDIHHLFIQVMDRGPGFPVDELPSLFNKFYRGTAASAGGTGLGLSIVKGFVEAQNGTVSADNRKNGGAIFTVKIPVKQTPQK